MPDQPKSIDTLIDDIYSVFTDGVEGNQDEIIDAFGEGMKTLLKTRLVPRDNTSKGYLRLSGIGKPSRQLWYDCHGYEKPELEGKKLLMFMYGDVIEELLLTLSQLAGHTVTNMQQTVRVNGIKGHIDAKIDGHVIDIKSASPYSFKKFANGGLAFDDPFGYMHQIASYKEGIENEGVGFLAMNKVDGSLAMYQPSEDILPDPVARVDELQEMLKVDTPPERCYPDILDAKTGNRKLDIGCVFCDFKKECWKDANNGQGLKGYKYAAMPFPLYLTDTVKVPQVNEIDIA